jgi:APA family basic amino acid/polyamine antiporter
MALGIVIYLVYGRRHSRLAGAEGEAAAVRLAADREARRTSR